MQKTTTEWPQSKYNEIWKKYRPVLLRLMIDAGNVAQRYNFTADEFKRINPTSKSALAFILYVRRSKALNNIKSSDLAQALLSTLQESKTAIELMAESTFEFMLDKKYVLHVKKAGVDEPGALADPVV